MSEDRDLRQDGSLTDPVVPDSGKQDRNRKKRKTARAAASFIVTGILLAVLIVLSVNIGSLKVGTLSKHR